jgi:hypothetical protein
LLALIKVDFSTVLELSKSKSTMCIIGDEKPLQFASPGAMKAFDADLFHRSGVAYSNTIKIAFFWRFIDADDVGEDAASSTTE